MLYRLPETADEERLQSYVREHKENGEMGISASMGLGASGYADWVERMHKNARDGDENWGKSLLYLCFEKERLVGLLSIRYALPPDLAEKYGHIGYGVRPSERMKGYATAMLGHALEICREMGKKQVILGCYGDNAASNRVIRKNGGRLTAENDRYTPGRISRYYTIDL